MRVGKLLVGAIAGGMLMLAVPAANALCFYCDETGCHATSGPCPPPPPSQEAMTNEGHGHKPKSTRSAGVGYTGDCQLLAFNDTTPGGSLGGNDVWDGAVHADAVANDAGPISATCSIKVNGADQGVVLDAGTGTGFVAAAGRVTLTAAVTDTVSVCTNVTTSVGSESVCEDVTITPVCPDPACGAGGAVDQAIAVLNQLSEQGRSLDPTDCAVLRALAPTVDGLASSDVLYVDPGTGDTFVGGTSVVDAFYDCPPYVPPGA
jgi:hypothetical protein